MNKLKWSILALAQPFEVQMRLFPDFVCVADELALSLEEAMGGLGSSQARDEPMDLAELRELDRYIESLSGEGHLDFWTDDALQSDPRWDKVRELARKASAAFGWEGEIPGPSSGIYIGG